MLSGGPSVLVDVLLVLCFHCIHTMAFTDRSVVPLTRNQWHAPFRQATMTRLNARGSFSLSSGYNIPRHLAIVGGGLAGLSTAFHFLEKHALFGSSNNVSVTIFDRVSVGEGGASAAAGGLVHPLSPRGKVVHLGIECLESTRRMVDCAVSATREENPKGADSIIVGQEILRVAVNEQQANQLQETARQMPVLAEWIEASEVKKRYEVFSSSNTKVSGCLRLSGSGCMVLHVPSYLRGLWRACEKLASDKGMAIAWRTFEQKEHLIQTVKWQSYDAVVLAAGSGLFHDEFISKGDLPVQLVRGQSLELRKEELQPLQSALLCGKYVSPLPEKDRVLVGATHEFTQDAMPQDEVFATLQDATSSFYPFDTSSVERLTGGVRVQSQRGKHGRRPVVGKYPWSHHPNSFIFTGLSSRGLLYHGYYGSALVDILLGRPCLLSDNELYWWRGTAKL